MSDTVNLLKSKLFKGLDSIDAQNYFSGLLSNICAYKKNDIIFSKDKFFCGIGIIVKGNVNVFKLNAENRRIKINRLSPSDCFGMAAVFSPHEDFPTEIIAANDCKVAFIKRAELQKLFIEFPQISLNYMEILTERIRFLNRRIETLACSDMKERLLCFLSFYCEDESEEFELPFSLQELSSRLLMSRATIYRTLQALSDENRIVRNKNMIRIIK